MCCQNYTNRQHTEYIYGIISSAGQISASAHEVFACWQHDQQQCTPTSKKKIAVVYTVHMSITTLHSDRNNIQSVLHFECRYIKTKKRMEK